MRQLFTIIMILLVSFAYAQRTAPAAQNTFDAEQARVRVDLKEDIQNELDLDTLYPGNFFDAPGYTNYIWGQVESEGFIFGTNDYGDHGYGQHFPVSAPHEIYGAFYWFGAAAGTTGNVKFKIWEFDGEPGDVLAETEVPLADIESSWTLWPDPDYEDGPQPGAFFVDFTDEDGNPVIVSGDYLIGVDITDLDPFDEDVNELGNISTEIGEGHPDDLAWIWEADGWIQVSVYLDGALDIGILPVVYKEAVTYEVTFHVDLSLAIDNEVLEDFDPEEHHIMITGEMFDWTEPDPDNEDMVLEHLEGDTYAITLHLEEGAYEYKYFSDAIDDGWDGGEWPGGDDRMVEVTGDMTVEDYFGFTDDEVDTPLLDDITLNIFPNPASDVFYIESDVQINEVRMFDVLGQVVYSHVANDTRHEISVGSMKNGVYFVQLTTAAGIVTERLQVTR